MRKALTIATAILAAALSALPAAAQNSGGGQGYESQQGAELLPPSAAVKQAMRAVPGAKPLGVKLRGNVYVVRLKQDGTITQIGVDAVTGAVMPLR
ncbi:PepSY domain-containing protein [Aestuariivirga sp.]|uniref:PepSY domain-containing protein n=1 Tax=Aestuariivirga sp. TaxID=2650926 RepID=UPI00391BBA99